MRPRQCQLRRLRAKSEKRVPCARCHLSIGYSGFRDNPALEAAHFQGRLDCSVAVCIEVPTLFASFGGTFAPGARRHECLCLMLRKALHPYGQRDLVSAAS